MRTVEQSFDRNWAQRGESHYNHWTPGFPRNQIQFAFRQHWRVFQPYLAGVPRSVLEVGSGRGSISSYFAAAGFDAVLLDYSDAAAVIARKVFRTNAHPGRFVVGDAFQLPVRAGQFGACVSIGLLEHFDDVGMLLHEQLRVLVPSGVLLAYVVPERADNVQRHFRWLNVLLKTLARTAGRSARKPAKVPLYRNGLPASAYVEALQRAGAVDIETFGLYPLPMISHSPEFPFSLLPGPLEKIITFVFAAVLAARRMVFRRDPWTCREEIGQAFLVVARKPRADRDQPQ